MSTAVCTEHGAETRLTCVTCETPICPKCLVETRVGFKCPTHGRVIAAAPSAPTDASPDRPARPGPARSGIRRPFLLLLPLILAIPVMTIAVGALFAVAADATGFVGLLPLIAVGLLLVGGTVFVASRLL